MLRTPYTRRVLRGSCLVRVKVRARASDRAWGRVRGRARGRVRVLRGGYHHRRWPTGRRRRSDCPCSHPARTSLIRDRVGARVGAKVKVRVRVGIGVGVLGATVRIRVRVRLKVRVSACRCRRGAACRRPSQQSLCS